eukprot:TRINITY_DN5207_c0_g1_i4.p1 TRINITY_DN5207_c0_g1~~TRINITY_DN5207_c0_g1_i4.p1  ORF type:complete len:399 (+),score=52.02 TRINITY_DN5207_c0_g1_i4:210-1406(+)
MVLQMNNNQWSKKVNTLYSIMRSYESKLGGGEGTVGTYGSLSETSMQRILDSMALHCSLGIDSIMVDIGAGLGRPLMHALVSPGVKAALGIELDHVKVSKAQVLMQETADEMRRRKLLQIDEAALPRIVCSGVEEVKSLEPGTHAYSFWEGVPVEGRIAFAQLFANSDTLKAVAVVQRALRHDPVEVMKGLGFGSLQLVDKFGVKMSGSRNGFTAYIFKRSQDYLNQLGSQLPRKPRTLDMFVGQLQPYPKRKRKPNRKYEDSRPLSASRRVDNLLKCKQSKLTTHSRPNKFKLVLKSSKVRMKKEIGGKMELEGVQPNPPSSSSTSSVVDLTGFDQDDTVDLIRCDEKEESVEQKADIINQESQGRQQLQQKVELVQEQLIGLIESSQTSNFCLHGI